MCYPSCYRICSGTGTQFSLSLHPAHIPQLHFALADATFWMPHYNGFNYEEFYEFIIDFFEADITPQAQEASAKLLEWWNKYVSVPFLFWLPLIWNPPQSGLPEVFSHTRSCTCIGRTSIPRNSATTTPGCPLIPPALVILCNTSGVCLFYTNITVFHEFLLSNA